jgi:hypothetical protein
MALGAFFTVIMVLIVMGRLPVQAILAPLGVALTFLLRMLPTFLRLLPLWQMLKSNNPFGSQRTGNRSSRKSVIRTEYLAMELFHNTGDMEGQVIKGRFEGQVLSAMALEQLLQLAGECQVDQDSQQVLEAYLDRMHKGWREHFQGGRESKDSTEIADEPAMTRQLALEILGLGDNATQEDVIKAHRRLMQKMHPDRGGTDYLAKKINAARDYLEQHL